MAETRTRCQILPSAALDTQVPDRGNAVIAARMINGIYTETGAAVTWDKILIIGSKAVSKNGLPLQHPAVTRFER